MTVLAVMVAGALGAVARFTVDGAIAQWRSRSGRVRSFPWATLLINVTGSFLLGVIAGMVTYHAAPTELQAIIGTGFCGGYTTFSTASVETVRLARGRDAMRAAANAIASVVGSVAACAVGLLLVWAV